MSSKKSSVQQFRLTDLQKELEEMQINSVEDKKLKQEMDEQIKKAYQKINQQINQKYEKENKKQIFPRQVVFQFQGKQHKFTIVKKLGSGVSANVYLVKDENRKQFALKEGKPNSKYTIQTQNNLLQKLKKKHLCKYFLCPIMYVPKENSADIVMTYLKNYMELRQAIQQKYNITKKNKDIIKDKLTQALNKLHENNFIHSDIKPENVMVKVSKTGKKILDDAKIIDMGGLIEFHKKGEKKSIRMHTPAYTDYKLLFPNENLSNQQFALKYRKKIHQECFDFETLKNLDKKALEKTFQDIDQIKNRIWYKRYFYNLKNK